MNWFWTWSDPRRLGTNHKLHEEQYLMMLAVGIALGQLTCLIAYQLFVPVTANWLFCLIVGLVGLAAVVVGLEMKSFMIENMVCAAGLVNAGCAMLLGVVVTPLTGVELYRLFVTPMVTVLVVAVLFLPVCRGKYAGFWQAASRHCSIFVLVCLLVYSLKLVFDGPEVFNEAVLAAFYSAWATRTLLLGMTLQRTNISIAVTAMAVFRDLIIYARTIMFGSSGVVRRPRG